MKYLFNTMFTNQTSKKQSIYLRPTDHSEIDQILVAYPGCTRSELNHYIILYGPLKANIIFNLERKKVKVV